MKYILGIMVIAVGIFMIIKTEWIVENFGTSDWAEANMGTSGGSRLLYKLIGLALIFGSMMMMTGMLGEIFISIFGRLFGLPQN